LNWEQVRALQTDMGHEQYDQVQVSARSEMFLNCINEVSAPSGTTLVGRLMGR
jgi:hypothetical protein